MLESTRKPVWSTAEEVLGREETARWIEGWLRSEDLES